MAVVVVTDRLGHDLIDLRCSVKGLRESVSVVSLREARFHQEVTQGATLGATLQIKNHKPSKKLDHKTLLNSPRPIYKGSDSLRALFLA